MLLAGRAAEKLYGIEREGSDYVDLQFAQETLERDCLSNDTSPERVARLQRRTHRLVRTPLVRFHIEMVRQMLYKRGTVSSDDIYSLLEGIN